MFLRRYLVGSVAYSGAHIRGVGVGGGTPPSFCEICAKIRSRNHGTKNVGPPNI